jgi:hypothetical protein
MMQEFARIGTIYRKDDDRLFSELVQIFPEGQTGKVGHAFHARLPLRDDRTQSITNALNDAGMRPWLDTSRPKDRRAEYGYALERVYDEADLAGCEYLELHPPNNAHNSEAISRNQDGEMIIPEQWTSDAFDILSGLSCWLFVPSRVKDLLEAGGLRHVGFRPTVNVPHLTEYNATVDMVVDLIPDISALERGSRDPDWPVPYWELESDFTLPPLSSSMSFKNSDGRPVDSGDFSRGFHRCEGPYIHPELHYRASDLKGLEPFDLARTYEPFGNHHGYNLLDRPMVASKRFYHYCVSHGLRTGWVPIRIDPD